MRGICHVLYQVHIIQDVAQLDGCWYIPMNIEITPNDKMFGVSVALAPIPNVHNFYVRRDKQRKKELFSKYNCFFSKL